MKIKKGFVLRNVCGEQVVMGEGLDAIDFGRLLCLNETAVWLWRKAEALGEFTVDALADAMCEEYEVAADEARADVATIINQWKEVGVVVDC